MGDDDKATAAGQGGVAPLVTIVDMTEVARAVEARGGRPLVLDSYARLSKVPETGELEKVEDQHADNGKVIDRVGGVLGLELSDGLSAWKKGVRRPGETAVESGRVLVGYSTQT